MQPFKSILKPLASLKLTVILLGLSMVLILAGTLAQRFDGIWKVQADYFHSLIVFIPFKLFLTERMAIPGGLPFPGGYPLGLMLLLNLLAAHATRFQYSWKRTGIVMIHLGLILLLVGEGISSIVRTEAQMTIGNGGSANFSSDTQNVELALIDHSAPDHDSQIVIPAAILKKGGVISDPQLTVGGEKFELVVEKYFPNSDEIEDASRAPPGLMRATAGEAKESVIVERKQTNGVTSKSDLPGAFVTVKKDGKSLGTFQLWAGWDYWRVAAEQGMMDLAAPNGQTVDFGDGRQLSMALRFVRQYEPFSLQLIKFSHDKYLGTQEAKNYSSQVRLIDTEHKVDREVLIRMNEPLRYRGKTIYQTSFQGSAITVLQVVDNPAWTMPYIACIIGGAGLLLHFGIMLVNFVNKRMEVLANAELQAKDAANAPARAKLAKGRAPVVLNPAPFWKQAKFVLPAVAVVIVLSMVVSSLSRGDSTLDGNSAYDINAFGSLPVSYDGRTQPLDSLGRNLFRVVRGKETPLVVEKTPEGRERVRSVSASQWLLDAFSQNDSAPDYQVFRIDHPQIQDMLGLPRQDENGVRSYFAMSDFSREGFDQFRKQAQDASEIEPADRDQTQAALVEQLDRIRLLLKIYNMSSLYLIAPLRDGEQWITFDEAEHEYKATGKPRESFAYLVTILGAYSKGKPVDFNRAVAEYRDALQRAIPAPMARVDFEVFHNRFDPFTQAMVLYVMGFAAIALSWIFWPTALRRMTLVFIVGAIVLHTFGLVARVYISGRPPVTNLASSALFIGWIGVLAAMFIEYLFRNGLAAALACVIGFPTLLIASRLALDGDTMKVLVAVLDTNIWLATHVVVITMGYAATFLAALFAMFYILFGFFSSQLNKNVGREVIRITYGITCFAVCCSFIGTILGGIWADQSWGRFWGWDPKENGAVLIVLANAVLLHARWAGWARDRGVAALAVFGGIVCSWSWFGTNMLGVGLHSYGFMSGAFWALLGWVVVCLGLITVACIPLRHWMSFGEEAKTASPSASPRGFPVQAPR